MNRTARTWLRLLARAALAVAAYHGGIVVALLYMAAARPSFVQVPLHFAFLLVPLRVVYLRDGPRDFLRVAALAFLILALFRGALAASALHELAAGVAASDVERAIRGPLPGVLYPLVAAELATVLALIAGLAWVDIYGPAVVRWRAAYRMLAATAAASVLALTMIALLAANHGFVESLQRLFANVLEIFARAAARAETPPPRLPGGDVIMQAFWDYLFGSLAFGYFVNLAGAWYVAGRIGRRSRFASGWGLKSYTLPDSMVWPLIGCWAVVLAGRFVKLGYLRAFALNGGLVLLALYAAQGLAIIEVLLARSRRANVARRWPLAVAIAVLIVPALTAAALVVIPLVGISEIWVRYRAERKERTDEGEGDT